MKLFLDTCSIEDIKKWKQFNFVEGVTTNPTLLSKQKNEPTSQLSEICSIVNGPVSAQVTEIKCENMIKQAISLKKIAKNIIIKLPATEDGYLAAKFLKIKKIKINVTVGFNPSQIIPFAKINVDYFSLILGKTEDWGFSNVESIMKSKKIIKSLNSKTKLLLASIRNEDHLIDSITNGADILTIPPTTWEKIFKNKYSKLALDGMLNDWQLIPKKNKRKYDIKK
jgi:transaldolase